MVVVQAAGLDGIRRAEVFGKIEGIHHRHHAVDGGPARQVDAVFFVHEAERLSHGNRLGDTCGLDEQVVEALLPGQLFNLDHQVFAKGTADAAVRHLHQPLFGAGERVFALNQLGINVDLAHVVNDHGHFQALLVVQDVVEQGSLSGSEEA